jgi:RNA recognition motif-containing protein
MAKRFTDTNKWNDVWFSQLPNDYKLVWIYILDTCDNAGIWLKNIKNLNFFCNTNLTEEDLIKTFSDKLSKITEEKMIVNKFCTIQYGDNFLESKNKAVLAAIKTLNTLNLIKDVKGIATLSIPYLYPIDTPKEQEQEQVKDKDKEQVKDKIKEIVKEKEQEKVKAKEQEFDEVFAGMY